MHGKMENQLIVIENGKLSAYALDDRLKWTVGRPTPDNIPDISFHCSTVSRRHGEFRNMDGLWFYLDHLGKNGTVCNGNHIGKGINGKVKPVMLKDGDVLIFGGSNEANINSKTVWALFCSHVYEGGWRVVDTKRHSRLKFSDGRMEYAFTEPEKGMVLENEDGMAIYMGDVTYLAGRMRIVLTE